MSVRTIKFQALPEDYDETKERRQSSTRKRKNVIDLDDQFNYNQANSKETKHFSSKANFSLEYSYPAVIFDKICFSVDKSQQQANFVKECLFRLKNCQLVGRRGSHSDDNKVNILKSVNLSVPYGSIFGLLGPSSCGKTTLLRCLVGLLQPTSGSVRLFGHNLEACRSDYGHGLINLGCLRSKSSKSLEGDLHHDSQQSACAANKCQVPGINVGYMPQDLGLYEDFTIKQILTMFGRYMRMESKLIEQRIEFMAQFLELPEVDRRIDSLSGGQKRRVSFAIACLHMPPLIILDEPTVGVDPLLRQSIWKYLRRLADEENKTIIITTHYIEEAAQADQVALMRAGEILVQDTPAKIMQLNQSKTLEEAFLRICNNVGRDDEAHANEQPNGRTATDSETPRIKLYPQPKFNWNQLDEFKMVNKIDGSEMKQTPGLNELNVEALKLNAQEKVELFDTLKSSNKAEIGPISANCKQHNLRMDKTVNRLSMAPNITATTTYDGNKRNSQILFGKSILNLENNHHLIYSNGHIDRPSEIQTSKLKLFKRSKLILNNNEPATSVGQIPNKKAKNLRRRMRDSFTLLWALLYKNYRRNVNSLPLLAFQFMLPVIQMISFSLCVGGRPTNIGLGLVNLDQPPATFSKPLNSSFIGNINATATNGTIDYPYEDYDSGIEELLSLKYLSFIDKSMLKVNNYNNMREALADVKSAKLWAVMEIGQNFTTSISKRFDLDNFYQLELDTIHQSIIKLYPDRSNKILDMICHRSLIDSYRKFLLNHFEHFKRLPIEVREPIFDIKPNVISNSIDGYTESIAPGLLASLTYIMAAGLTTFIMVVERSAGILERTYTTGINPISYLLAHAIFRSFVMMLQVGLVLILTFYVLKQPLVGSIWLAYAMLMTLNITGISYGLLISSIVTDQNGAALTIVSSLVVKITMSGILWPFEAIPNWLRIICYIQPLTMPVQALKAITLKGSSIGDRAVNLGFLVSVSWFIVFLTISTKRFRFYQH